MNLFINLLRREEPFYWKCNIHMKPHSCHHIGWLVGMLVAWSVIITKNDKEVTIACSYRRNRLSPPFISICTYIHVWKLHMYIMYTYCSLTIMYVYKHIHTHSVFWWMTRGCPLGPECTHIHSFIHSFIHLYLYPPHSLRSIYKNDVLSKSIFLKDFRTKNREMFCK